jgi:hypothetical protein
MVPNALGGETDRGQTHSDHTPINLLIPSQYRYEMNILQRIVEFLRGRSCNVIHRPSRLQAFEARADTV